VLFFTIKSYPAIQKVTASKKNRISITVLTKARHSMISFYILRIIYLKLILISSLLRA